MKPAKKRKRTKQRVAERRRADLVLRELWSRLVETGLVNPHASEYDIVFDLRDGAESIVNPYDDNDGDAGNLYFVTLELPVDLRGLEAPPDLDRLRSRKTVRGY